MFFFQYLLLVLKLRFAHIFWQSLPNRIHWSKEQPITYKNIDIQ